jgi:hypothetical protein
MRICFAAGVGMAMLAFVSWLALDAGLPSSGNEVVRLLREVVLVGVPVIIGAIAYITTLHRFDLEEIHAVRRAVLGKISPRFAG